MDVVYVLLALVGLVLAFYSGWADKRNHLLAAQLSVSAALILLADWIAFGWFQLYDYHPHLSRAPLQDTVFGEVLAEMFFVPGLTVFLDRWVPGLPGIAAGATAVTGIEYALLQMGLFTHHRWSLWYTAGGFAVYLGGLNRFWRAVRQGNVPDRWVMGLVRSGVVFDMVAFLTLYLMFMGHVKFNVAIMPTAEGNQALGRFLAYVPIMLLLGCWVSAVTGTVRLWRLTAAVALFAGSNSLLTVIGFLVFVPPWGVAIDTVARGAAILAAAFLLDHLDPQDAG
jgi:hypothetical protein